MPGEHGSLLDYVRAYTRYGGKPPIPEWSEHRRGSRRRRGVSLSMTSGALVVGLLPVAYVLTVVSLPASPPMLFLGALAFLWLGTATLVSGMVFLPLGDWYEDVPRYGLPSVGAAPEMEVVG